MVSGNFFSYARGFKSCHLIQIRGIISILHQSTSLFFSFHFFPITITYLLVIFLSFCHSSSRNWISILLTVNAVSNISWIWCFISRFTAFSLSTIYLGLLHGLYVPDWHVKVPLNDSYVVRTVRVCLLPLLVLLILSVCIWLFSYCCLHLITAYL